MNGIIAALAGLNVLITPSGRAFYVIKKAHSPSLN